MRQALIISLTALATATLTILSMNAVYGPANSNSVAHATASIVNCPDFLGGWLV